MRKLDSSVPHRLGRRTNFIPPLEGRPAKWAEVVDAAAERDTRAAVAKASVATVLIAGDDGAPLVETADVDALKGLLLTNSSPFGARRPIKG